MAEEFKRDQKSKKIVQICGIINRDREKADMALLTVWQKELDKTWTAFEQMHEAVIDRSGVAELEEQQKMYEEMDVHFINANVVLEQLRINLNQKQGPVPDAQGGDQNDQRQQHRRYFVMAKRLQSACDRVMESIDTMQLVEIDIEKKGIENLHFTMQEMALDYMSQVGNQDDIIAQEEASSVLYRNTLLSLMTAHANHNIQPVAPIAGNDADALKVPQLNIVPFAGQFEKWEAFRESFTHGIHMRVNMPAVQKLQFLKGVLRDEPEELIRNFGLTAENYECAWKLLNDRYNNRRELIMSHIRALIFLPVCSESADDLRRLTNKTSSSLLALKNLGRPIAEWDDWIVFHICEKLDNNTRCMWEQSQAAGDELLTWEDLDKFLQGRIRALSCVGTVQQEKQINRFRNNKQIRTHQTSTVPVKKYVCSCCNNNHLITFCEKFRRLTPSERRQMVAEKSLCFICLTSGHMAQHCKSTRSCHLCNQRHNTMLHLTDSKSNNGTEVVVNTANCMYAVHRRPQVLLATAIVNVSDNDGKYHQVRALIDQGSEASFISEKLAQALQLPRQKAKENIIGFGGVHAGSPKQSIMIHVSDCHGYGFATNIYTMVMPCVTGRLAKMSVSDGFRWPHIIGLQLADPEYMDPHSIDLLLGSDVYGQTLLPGLRKKSGLPTAQNTVFGWILSGIVQNTLNMVEHSIRTHHVTIDDQLAKFWEIEEISTMRHLTAEEEKCEAFYEQTVSRDTKGRIHVRIPMKHDNVRFGESEHTAVQRQFQIERRFKENIEFAERYRKFMAQYIELGHMREVIGAKINLKRSPTMLEPSRREYYIPHHAVIKEASSTTKLRVVFDASRKTTNGKSLNEEMLIGPRLQEDLTAIMMRWRKFRIAFCADIEKMYRQIMVDEPDNNLQRIVWRPTPNERMKIYQLCTVTYGTASAPYLAVKSLQTLANLERNNYPIGADIVLNNFYVDDVLCGADTVAECLEAQKELISLLSSGGLALRKWASNCNKILEVLNPAHCECKLPLSIDDGTNISTLGVQWNPASDEMSFKIGIPSDIEKWTKRTFLSAAARLYDPLGWLTPCTVVVKMMFQSLWKLHLEWDDAIPDNILIKWNEIRTTMHQLTKVRINRWIGTTSVCEIEVHGFCDASMDAYAAVVYARVHIANQKPSIYNLCAKTKVAPIKVISLPRLELCGAALLVKLIENVKSAMQWPSVKVYCWTDSTIVLSWLRGHPSEYNVFVANRTSEIQRKIPIEHWQHVASSDNPADCASRGITPQQLLYHRLWWTGPKWLCDESSTWPHQLSVSETKEEKRMRVFKVIVGGQCWDLINKYSSWRQLVRVTAYCMRFTHNCRISTAAKVIGQLRTSELEHSREFWVKCAQEVAFHEELRRLENKTSICATSSLRALNPKLSPEKVLCVGGRLINAHGITETARTPAIIPRRSKLSALLISEAHYQTLHGGPTLMLAYIRRAYWIIDGPNEVRQYVKRCTVCFRYSAKPENQLMSALPAARVVPSRPFRNCAMDYSGAIMVRSAKGRGHHATKAYVVVFVCLATKAVHVELAGDLTTTGFIAAYERFTARRGCCTDIYSDNATNFVGAAKFLKSERKIFNNKVQTALANKGTTWHFSPPLSPHFNGLAESAIRSVKHHIRRVIGESKLTFEEFTTVLAKIEACLNSRPLCPLNSDPNDFEALTPGHFLIGEPITTVVQRDILECKPSALTRWQLTHQIVQRFWKRWSVEYLHTLQQRRKWQQPKDNLRVNDMVLIIEDNLSPAKWALGRVSEVHPGNDGNVRVVTIRTKNSTLKRSVVKVARLPIDVNYSNETETT